MKIVSDDIGSFPLPEGVDRGNLRETAAAIVDGDFLPSDVEEFNGAVVEMMKAKVASGLDAPTYPQIHEMVDGIYGPIEKYSEPDEPFVIVSEKAMLPEMLAVESYAKEYMQDTGKPLPIRVCVTGPLDIYIRQIATQVDGDLLMNLAKSVGRFVENAVVDTQHMKTVAVSLDEPSFGLNPNIIVEEEALVSAWDIAAAPAKELDVQIHLHSPSDVETLYKTENIKILGIEAAENPRNLDAIEKTDLETHDKYLRVGVARSNIAGLIAEYEQQSGVNVGSEPGKAVEMVDAMEPAATIKKRLLGFAAQFGDRIKYAGVDCGLGLWPNIESAQKILSNTVSAINEFNSENK